MRSLLLLWLFLWLAPAAALDDPMRPPGHARAGATGKSKPVWHLSAIRIDGAGRMAIINGRQVAEGDRVNGARVLEIQPQQVRLAGRQGAFSVRLVKTRVKQSRHPATD